MTPEQELELGLALLSGIKAIIDAFTAKSGVTLNAAQVQTAVAGATTALTTSIAADDTVADHAIDVKFPPASST